MLNSVSSSVRDGLLKSKYQYVFLIVVILYVLQLGYLAIRKKIDVEMATVEAFIGLKFIILFVKYKLDEGNIIVGSSASNNSLNSSGEETASNIHEPVDG